MRADNGGFEQRPPHDLDSVCDARPVVRRGRASPALRGAALGALPGRSRRSAPGQRLTLGSRLTARTPPCIVDEVPSTATKRAGWVLLAFRLPREPSTPRIALWRKLKRLGVVQLLDGLVALPLDSRNREQLEWLANDVQEAGGEATVWLAEVASSGQERELVSKMEHATAGEYYALIAE